MTKNIYLISLLFISVYFVIGGISNILIEEKFETAMKLPKDGTSDLDNGVFRNIQEQSANEEYEKMTVFFPLYDIVGSTVSYIITLMCFGILGSILRILLISLTVKDSFKESNTYISPILGGLLGLLTLVISELLPEFKDESGNAKVYYSMALLGGIYTQEIFKWLHKRLEQILHTENQADVVK